MYRQILLSFIFFALSAHELLSFELILIQNGEVLQNLDHEILRNGLTIDEVKVESDIFFSQDEFEYLTEIRPGAFVNTTSLVRAADYLKKKNKFDTVTASFICKNNRYFCHVRLQSLWTFSKVKFEGLFVGKDTYRHLYGMEQGEQFDQVKHRYFVSLIKQSLINRGYCAAQVYDYCTYDYVTKTVMPIICLVPGGRFFIRSVTMSVENAEADQELAKLQRKLNARYSSKLLYLAYDVAVINKNIQILKEYLARKGYHSNSIQLKTVEDLSNQSVNLFLNFSLRDKRKFVFFGNQYFDKKKLIEHCLTFGRSADIVPLSLIHDELLELYRSCGFWHASIQSQKEGNKVIFLINEGERAVVDKILIDGNAHIQHDKIIKSFFGHYFKKKRFFDSALIKHSISELTKWYKAEGFDNFKIEKQDVKKIGTDSGYELHLTLFEGERTFIDSVAIFPEDVHLKKLLSIQKPALLTPRLLHEQKSLIIDYFQKKGFFAVVVKSDVVKIDETRILQWHIQLTQPQTVFGKIVLQGVCQLPFNLILKNMMHREDAPWDQEYVRKNFLKLRDLKIFETIYPHSESVVDNPLQKALILKLIQDDPFEVRLRGGFQQVSKNFTFRGGTTYKAGGSLMIKNPFNRADMLHLDVDMTRFYHNIAGFYKRPWLFGLPINVTLKGYTHTYVQPLMLGLVKPLYKARQLGGMVGFDYTEQKKQWGFNTGFELLETNNLSIDLAEAINFKPFLIDKLVPYIYIEPNVFIDKLDDKLNPKKGMLLIISCKGMFPLDKNGVPFFKMLYENSFFTTFYTTVVGIHVRFGYIYSRAFEIIMPIDRFYLGGENSLRGYMPDLAPPLGTYHDEHGNKRLVPQGGRCVFNGNLEWRFPIFGSFWGALFEDIGLLLSSAPLSTIRGNSFIGSTGFGLRYLTPIGPLRFDVGFKWNRQDPEDHRAAWFLTLGHAF